jgi:predicted amidohydrolase
MKVGYVQMDCEFGNVDANLSMAHNLLKNVEGDLFVLPELFNSGYYFRDRAETKLFAEDVPSGKATQFLVNLAREKKCFIVAGLAEKANSKIYNSSVLVSPSGYLATYRKIHLFNLEKECFDPGDKPFFVVDIGLCKLGMMICFDWIFPESMRSLALVGADIICHPANLVLSYCQDATITRCIENKVFSITANRIGKDQREFGELAYTGKSQITGPMGKVLATAPENEADVHVVDIDVSLAREKHLNPHNDLLADRRPEMYNY